MEGPPEAKEELVEHGPVAPARVLRTREADSMGWLSESTFMPKKQKVIEGVGAASIVDLKAQLYRTQEEVKMHKDGTLDPREKLVRKQAGINVGELAGGGRRNAGVEERDARDRLELKGTADRAGECYAALEKKAQLYEAIASGKAPDNEEMYSVDFLRKGYLEDESPGPAPPRVEDWGEGPGLPSDMHHQDMDQEQERRSWEQETVRDMEGEKLAQQARRERIAVVEELNKETVAGRERAQGLKARREEQATRNREKLRLAFIAKQAKKIKAAGSKKQAGAGGGGGGGGKRGERQRGQGRGRGGVAP